MPKIFDKFQSECLLYYTPCFYVLTFALGTTVEIQLHRMLVCRFGFVGDINESSSRWVTQRKSFEGFHHPKIILFLYLNSVPKNIFFLGPPGTTQMV